MNVTKMRNQLVRRVYEAYPQRYVTGLVMVPAEIAARMDHWRAVWQEALSADLNTATWTEPSPDMMANVRAALEKLRAAAFQDPDPVAHPLIVDESHWWLDGTDGLTVVTQHMPGCPGVGPCGCSTSVL